MSNLYVFVCAKTTNDFVIPSNASTIGELARRVSIFARGLVGGVLTVGDLKLRPTQDAIPNHVLCDGSTISRLNYPQLVDFLAGTDLNEATLPDYSGAVTAAVPTVTQEVSSSGTVTTGTETTDQGDVGGTTGGNTPSGGRQYDPNGYYPDWVYASDPDLYS